MVPGSLVVKPVFYSYCYADEVYFTALQLFIMVKNHTVLYKFTETGSFTYFIIHIINNYRDVEQT